MPLDTHGCPACPHPGIGPAIGGSPDVMVNRRPALRVDDPGIHAACCGANTWTATQGSTTVFINGKGAHRIGDQTRHCGGMGQLVEGSPNVIVGESSSSGAGAQARRESTSTKGTSGGGSAGGGTGGGGSGGAGSGGAGSGGAGSGSAGTGGAGPGAGVSSSNDGSASSAPDSQPTFVEIDLRDDRGNPVAGERYRVITADGGVKEGRLDEQGFARIDGVPAGTCKITFPDRDGHEWSNR